MQWIHHWRRRASCIRSGCPSPANAGTPAYQAVEEDTPCMARLSSCPSILPDTSVPFAMHCCKRYNEITTVTSVPSEHKNSRSFQSSSGIRKKHVRPLSSGERPDCLPDCTCPRIQEKSIGPCFPARKGTVSIYSMFCFSGLRNSPEWIRSQKPFCKMQ